MLKSPEKSGLVNDPETPPGFAARPIAKGEEMCYVGEVNLRLSRDARTGGSCQLESGINGKFSGGRRGQMGIVDDLTKLAELHRAGALTDAEYAAAKSRLIDCPPAAPPPLQTVTEPVATVSRSDPEPSPKWMKPWGWFLVWLGGLGFAASTYLNWRTDHEAAALLSGLLNPMFFIGMPIGLYWLTRSGVTVGGIFTAINHSTLSEEEKRRRGL